MLLREDAEGAADTPSALGGPSGWYASRSCSVSSVLFVRRSQMPKCRPGKQPSEHEGRGKGLGGAGTDAQRQQQAFFCGDGMVCVLTAAVGAGICTQIKCRRTALVCTHKCDLTVVKNK